MAHPIWKDYIISVDADVVEFVVSQDAQQIYSGKAFRKPNANTIDIKINDICANYFRNPFPSNFPNVETERHPYVISFVVELYYNDTNENYIIQFYNDWSGSEWEDTSVLRFLTAPISNKVPQGVPIVSSRTQFFNVANVVQIPTENSAQYEVVGDCYRYMLYYLNAMGGWDFLLIEGKEKQTDNYTRYTIGQTYNNDQSRNRGTRNYRNDIARKWELHTLWIDDAGAQNMHHLLGSTDVYLYDMQTEQLHPITIANTSCEYKTYSNNGNQLIRYDIEATLARNIIRR